MALFRLIIRAILLLLNFVVLYFILLLGYFVLIFTHDGRIAWRNWFVQNWSKSILAVLGVKVYVNGTPPEQPFILVSNHLSYLDIPVFFTQVHGVFVSRHDVANWPLFGPISRSIGTIFIDRSKRSDVPRVNAEINDLMQKKTGLIIFPEGTSTGGKEILPFKRSLFEYAAANDFPISCASLQYKTGPKDLPPQEAVCYFGGMVFVKHIFTLMKTSHIEAHIFFSQDKIKSNERKELAEKAYEKVMAVFQQTYHA